jgi:small subunit ribosomal protein S18
MAKRIQKTRENTRRPKRKVSVLVQEEVDYIDWKDVNLLRRFMSDRAKIRARRVTGNNSQQQRQIAVAIKNAREMALLPYTSRVTTQRGRPRGDGDERPRRRREESTEEFAPLDATAEAPTEATEAPASTEAPAEVEA